MGNSKSKGNTIAGSVFVGCMFIGLGMGMLYSAIPIGIIIGMGVGFLAMAGIRALYAKSDSDEEN